MKTVQISFYLPSNLSIITDFLHRFTAYSELSLMFTDARFVATEKDGHTIVSLVANVSDVDFSKFDNAIAAANHFATQFADDYEFGKKDCCLAFFALGSADEPSR